jgi:hypothetical protein
MGSALNPLSAGGPATVARPETTELPAALLRPPPASALGSLAQAPRAGPRVFVIDDFTVPAMNVNRGDTVPDKVSHGDAVAAVLDSQLGVPAQRVDVGDWARDPASVDRFLGALQRIVRETRASDYPNLVLSISLAASEGAVSGDPKMTQLRDTLDWMARAGAHVCIAAGNDFDNALATPAMTVVGGSDGGVGFARDSRPSSRLIANPLTDVVRNAMLVSNPVYENGRLTGYSLTGQPRVTVPLDRITDVSARIQAVQGRPATQAAMSVAELKALVSRVDALPYEQRRAFDVSAYGDRVVRFEDLRTALREMDRSSTGFAVPPGVQKSNLYVTLPGVLSHQIGIAGTAQVVFFQTDRQGMLRHIGDNGPSLVSVGSSLSTPQEAASPSSRPALR